MTKNTLRVGIFAAALGFTLVSGLPTANAVVAEAGTCPATRTVTTPGSTIQKEISPAVPAVTRIEFEYRHTKNEKQEPRWEPEGWNAEGNPNSDGGWAATGATRVVEVSPAIAAVYETIHVPGTTVVEPIPGSDCSSNVPADEKTPTDGNTPAEAPPAGETHVNNPPVPTAGSTDAGTAGAVLGSATFPVSQAAAETAGGLDAPAAGFGPASAVGSLADTGSEGITSLLAIGALAAGGGALLFGASKLRTRRAA